MSVPQRGKRQGSHPEGMKAEQLLAEMRAVIEAEPLAKIDYVSAVDALTMENVDVIDRDVLVAMAVYIGKTRLTDNFSWQLPQSR